MDSDSVDSAAQLHKYLDNDERFGFMKRGRPSVCKVLNCAIGTNDNRFWDNHYKRGPICFKCASAVVRTETPEMLNQLDVLANEQQTTLLRVRRLEDFFKTSASFVEHMKTWRPPDAE